MKQEKENRSDFNRAPFAGRAPGEGQRQEQKQKDFSVFQKATDIVLLALIFAACIALSVLASHPLLYTVSYLYIVKWIFFCCIPPAATVLVIFIKNLRVCRGILFFMIGYATIGFLVFVLAVPGYPVSKTTDFSNYRRFDYSEAAEFFPENIAQGECVHYSYYYTHWWDPAGEIYLEVRVDGEKYDELFTRAAEKYVTAENPVRPFAFDEDFLEISAQKDFFYFHSDETVSIDTGKVLFGKDGTIVYVYALGADPVPAKEIYFFRRFSIDLRAFDAYVNGTATAESTESVGNAVN